MPFNLGGNDDDKEEEEEEEETKSQLPLPPSCHRYPL